MNDKGCKDCQYFIKHDFYDFLGFCVQKDRLITERKICSGQKDIDREKIKEVLEDRGWVYCISCDEPIFSLEELKEHKEGRVVEKRFSDDIASEDSHAAD